MTRETRASKKKVISKKHLARIERERLQTRYILIGSIVVVALAVGLLGYGLLDQKVITPLKPVAKVNGESISLKDFEKRAKYIRLVTVQRAEQTYQFMQLFGNDPQFQQYYLNSLQQLDSQLQTDYLGQTVVSSLEDEKLIRQEAKKRNITVSKDEVDKLMQEIMGYYPNGTPTLTPTFEPQPTSTMNPTQYALISPTPTATATATQVITATATVTGTAKLTPSASASTTATLGTQSAATGTPNPSGTPAVTDTPGPSPTLEPTQSPTPYTEDLYKQTYQSQVQNLQTQIGFTETDYRALAETELLQKKLQEAIVGKLDSVQDFVWLRQIQVTDEATAKQVMDRLGKGEDFGKIANEVSTDAAAKTTNGDLGWMPRRDLESKYGTEVAKAAFESLQVGQTSQPINSAGAWHIIQLIGHEKRTLSPDELDQQSSTIFQDWLTKTRDSSKIESNDLWKNNVPTTPDVSDQIKQLLNSNVPK
jgi:parvulin-like peptidyl-prolyl isomerase